MPSDFQIPSFKHDAFIAYSRKDIQFAIKLELALENYKPPKGLNLPQRYLDVFRDEKDFGTGEYYQAVERHLASSAKLIVLCSPQSRQSQYVNHEIELFAKLRGAENIIPILIEGIPNNEVQPGKENQLAFPDSLCKLMKMPLAARYLGFDLSRDKLNKRNFYQAWYDLLAAIYDRSPSEIEQHDRKKESRTRKIRIVLVTGIIAILSTTLIFAEVFRQAENIARKKAEASDKEAQRQRDVAIKAREGEAYQRKKAEASTVEAVRQRDIAEDRRRFAVEQQLKAEANERISNAYFFDASMNLAQNAFDEDNRDRGNEILNRNCSRVCWLEIPINWLTHQFDQCGKDVFTFEPRCRDDRLQGG
ncbi:MAG: TIR domain-containing protein, partial [Blastocatellales bacterium]